MLSPTRYQDSFETALAPGDTRTAEELMRSGLEGAPGWIRVLVPVIHRRVLLLRLGPLNAPERVLGWLIDSSGPDRVVLRAESPLAAATIDGCRTDGVLRLTTTLDYRRPVPARVVWAVVGPLHRLVAPILLSRAARAGAAAPAGPEPRTASARRRRHIRLWRVVNPVAKRFAGRLPWWLLLETTGRRTGRPHQVPLATGPEDPDGIWLIAVHGRKAGWVRNVEAHPSVRVRLGGRWRTGAAEVHPFDPLTVARFTAYARGGPPLFGDDPLLVFVRWT